MSLPASLHALMSDLIDYAGLFPPARLDMATAIENHARYRQGPEAWMLGRFIVPAARLDELSEVAGDHFESASPFRFSVLARGGESSDTFLNAIESAVAHTIRFRERHGEHVRIEMLETPMPSDVLDTLNLQDDERLFSRVADRVADLGDGPIFYEVTSSDRWAERVALAVEAIAAYNQRSGRQTFGFKLRCGGTPNPAFPSTEQVAYALDLCRAARVPLKATAGLHQPLHHVDRESGHSSHGFFNLFGAGLLAWQHGLSMNALVPVVQDQSASSFRFTNEAFAWGEWSIGTDRLAARRRDAFISYGSCSFDEPVEALQALGYEMRIAGEASVAAR